MIGKRRQHIVFISEFISPDSNSTGEYFFDIAVGFLDADCELTCVVPESVANKEAIEELRQDYGVQLNVAYVETIKEHHGASLAKAISSLRLTFALWRVAKRSVRPQSTLFFGTNPTFLVALSYLWFPVKHVKKVLLCYDIFPDNLSAVSNSALARFAGRLLRPLFKKSYQELSKVLVIGRCMAERVKALGVQPEKIAVVTNWANEDEISVASNHSQRSDAINFQFFGNMGPLQGVEQLLSSFEYVKSKNVRFTFVGRGACVKKIESFAARNTTLVAIKMKGAVPKSERNIVLNDCDVAVVSLAEQVTGLGVPSKSYFSLAAGKPLLVLADRSSEPAMLVNEHALGWHASLQKPQEIAACIDHICQQRKLPTASYIRSIFENHFSRKVALGKVVGEVCNLSKQSS